MDYERGASNPEEVSKSCFSGAHLRVDRVWDYDNIRAFIYDLETAPDFVVIDNIVLAEAQTTGRSPCDLSTYSNVAPADERR